MLWKTIITYLLEWTPGGIKTVQFSSRTIIGISIPRKDFEKSREREELIKSGVYLLLWEDENGEPLVYIGQATVLGKRLNDHDKDIKKDFWNTAIAFTTKNWDLNESDINYLERELIRKAEWASRYVVKNGNSGNSGLIQEYRIPDMIEYISDLEILLSSLWFNVLQELVTKEEKKDNLFFLKERGSNARWVYTDEWLVVLEGSEFSPQDIIPYQKALWHIDRKREKLVEIWVISDGIFRKDFAFKTPTAACNIIAWGNQNGWLEWKTKDGKTLDEIERRNL